MGEIQLLLQHFSSYSCRVTVNLHPQCEEITIIQFEMNSWGSFWTDSCHIGPKCPGGGNRGIQSHLHNPITEKWRNKRQSGSHPLPHGNCDFQSCSITPENVQQRGQFSDTKWLERYEWQQGKALSPCVCDAVAVKERDKDREKKEDGGEIKQIFPLATSDQNGSFY